jgi:site-specific recombinase XerD
MTTISTAGRRRRPATANFVVPEPVGQHPSRPVGPIDHLPADEVLELVAGLPFTSPAWSSVAGTRQRGARLVLAWLETMPGEGWQDRWLAADADAGLAWVDQLTGDNPRGERFKREEVMRGLAGLLLCRLVQPSYTFLTGYKAVKLFTDVQTVVSPDLFVRVRAAAQQRAMTGDQVRQTLTILTKMVLHTGKDLDQITVEDFYELHAWGTQGHGHRTIGIHGGWDLLRDVGVLTATAPLRAALRAGQRPTSELVDRYQIICRPVRDVLVRYLGQRRPALDYSSFRQLVSTLAGTFWADLEAHDPGIATLDLPPDVAEAWKQRLLHLTGDGVTVRVRKNRVNILTQVRAFYLDIAEWALEDASWAQWAVPSPVRRADLEGFTKHRRQTSAEMHQRVRDRLPHLPLLVATAEQHRDEQAALLAEATRTTIGAVFTHDGRSYRRTEYQTAVPHGADRRGPAAVLVEDLTTGQTSELLSTEDDAFWAWAILETLRHTGVRREELLEITHLALVSYRLPDTGEVIPLLQIVPSKVNEERLLLVTPELASVLAAIVRRVRSTDGRIPLVGRYDQHERTTGPPLPHLFQRRRGWRHEVISTRTVVWLLNETTRRAGLTDQAGAPLRYTPHDFRRLFATDAVTGGLPVHIAAKILGHHNLATTQSYLAVFQDELIRSYRAFLDKRRAVRPEAEYREPTDQEWRDFQQHFELRKLELGTCGRPYGTPCQHEHACLRCPSLRVDPRQRTRLIEIIGNLSDRISEARINGWLGEVQGLQTSLDAAKRKLVSLDRVARNRPDITDLGMPTTARSKSDKPDPP